MPALRASFVMKNTIHKDDVVGARITDVHIVSTVFEGSSSSSVYFTLDSGITFELPHPTEFSWKSTNLPSDAKKIEDEVIGDCLVYVKRSWFGRKKLIKLPPETNDTVKKIKRSPIRGVFCRKLDGPDDIYDLDAAFILFEDGGIASCSSFAPAGIISGVFYRSPEEAKKILDMVDIFDALITEEWRNPCGES